MKGKYDNFKICFFYILEEVKIITNVENKKELLITIIYFENENIK